MRRQRQIVGPGSTRNSRSARWASKSSTGRNCRRCSVRGKIQDCRNSTARRYTSILEHTLVCRRLPPSDQKRERCCSAADDSRAGSRSHANDGCAARERARRTQWLASAPRELHLMRRMCGTLAQHTRSAIQMRQVVGNFASMPRALGSHQPNDDREPWSRLARCRALKNTLGAWPLGNVTLCDAQATSGIYVDQSIRAETATMRTAIAVAEHANHIFERQMAKPVSATMSHAAAINSAMRATPFGVIICVANGAEALRASAHCLHSRRLRT
jgi:hypothetical protein